MSEKKNGNEEQSGAKRSRRVPTGVIVTVFFLVTVSVIFIIFLKFITYVDDPEPEKIYDKYYAMIVPEQESSFWNEVCQSARKVGEEKGIYVEQLGSSMLRRYSREDLFRIAVAQSVDGIVVAADESDEMRELITLATDAGIPVVTLMSDCPSSDRCSFVGVSNYNIGREYGDLILRHARTMRDVDTVRAAVLVNSYTEESGQNILCMGIQETVESAVEQNLTGGRKIEISLVPVDDSNVFSAQEDVRELIFGPEALNPDIIVCLSETETTGAYQTIVDYNKVGVITVLGYHDSPAILNAIYRKVIDATVSIDTDQLGSFCVEALSEYSELGYTSQYFTADSLMIDTANVSGYLRKEADGEE